VLDTGWTIVIFKRCHQCFTVIVIFIRYSKTASNILWQFHSRQPILNHHHHHHHHHDHCSSSSTAGTQNI